MRQSLLLLQKDAVSLIRPLDSAVFPDCTLGLDFQFAGMEFPKYETLSGETEKRHEQYKLSFLHS